MNKKNIFLLLIAILFFFQAASFAEQKSKIFTFGKVKVEIKQIKHSGLKSLALYTIINRKKYFIDYLTEIIGDPPDPIIDPSGKYIFYGSNEGCGFEGEGVVLFRSDIYGKKKFPFLGQCEVLNFLGFFSYNGKQFVLIDESNGGTAIGTSFWLYDTEDNKFAIHAEGEIKPIGKNLFSFGYYDNDEKFKTIGKVTMSDLINRRKPLRLWSRYPRHALTRKKNTKVILTSPGGGCYDKDSKDYDFVPKTRTEVLLLEKCPDGGYEIYWNGIRGKVQKGALKLLK